MCIKMIPLVDAEEFPINVRDWFESKEIEINEENNLLYVFDDGNIFAEHLKKNGIVFDGYGQWVAIEGIPYRGH